MKKNDVHIVARHTKICTSVVFIHTSRKRKKSTVNPYNLILYQFHIIFIQNLSEKCHKIKQNSN